METRFQTGTVVSAIGHAGVILWVLVGDWLFSPAPPQEIVLTSVDFVSSAEFDAMQQAATAAPAPEPAPLRPQARPEPPPEPGPEPEVVPQPSDFMQAETEQALDSESTEIQPLAEAEEIIAPDPVQPESEAEASDTPTPAVAEDPAAEQVIEQPPTEETVARDTGDVTLTEANQNQREETGMTTSLRPRAKPARPAPQPEVAAAEPPREVPREQPREEPPAQPVDNAATQDAIDALLGEAVETPVETAQTGGQNRPLGPPLTGGEMGNISSAIARRWNLGAASTDVLSTMVVIRVTFGPDGRPIDFQLIESNGPTQAAVENLFSIARRAVNRTHAEGGIPLPPDKYETWRVLELVFDANGMRAR